jgi:hypothetical protein
MIGHQDAQPIGPLACRRAVREGVPGCEGEFLSRVFSASSPLPNPDWTRLSTIAMMGGHRLRQPRVGVAHRLECGVG